MGIDASGAAANYYSVPVNDKNYKSAGTVQVYSDTQDVVYAMCSFGNSSSATHVTQVTFQRL